MKVKEMPKRSAAKKTAAKKPAANRLSLFEKIDFACNQYHFMI